MTLHIIILSITLLLVRCVPDHNVQQEGGIHLPESFQQEPEAATVPASNIPPSVQFIYDSLEYRLIWFDPGGKFRPMLSSLEESVELAVLEGWDTIGTMVHSCLGQVAELKSIRAASRKREMLEKLDPMLTETAFLLAWFEAYGNVKPFQWEMPQRQVDVGGWLIKALGKGAPIRFTELQPRIMHAAEWGKWFRYLEFIDRHRAGDPVVVIKKIEPSRQSGQLPAIRKLLSQLVPGGARLLLSRSPWLFDSAMVEAVRHFQRLNGLYPDGIIGLQTLLAINRSPDSLLWKLRLNFQRLKWMPELPASGTYILVNIPSYEVLVYENRKVMLRMRSIVGTKKKETPVFSDSMEYLVLSPYWHIPKSIAGEEIWPKVLDDPNYLRDRDMVVFVDGQRVDSLDWSSLSISDFEHRIRIRQNPGKYNSLGSIKFMFPNRHWVYLHDTNAKYLFSKQGRSLSHGCVRIEKSVDLAMYLLRDNPDWDTTRLLEAMDSTVQTKVYLKKKIPIYLTYFTAWVDDNGELNFRDDIYGLDEKLDSVMIAERQLRKQLFDRWVFAADTPQ